MVLGTIILVFLETMMILMRMRVNFLKQSTRAVRCIKWAREGEQGKASQAKARVWKLFQRMLSGAQRSSATEKHSEQELSRRRTFRALDY